MTFSLVLWLICEVIFYLILLYYIGFVNLLLFLFSCTMYYVYKYTEPNDIYLV